MSQPNQFLEWLKDHGIRRRRMIYTRWMENEKTELPCADKIVYETKSAAEGAAAAADWQHGASLKPYKCQHCTHWHLASA